MKHSNDERMLIEIVLCATIIILSLLLLVTS